MDELYRSRQIHTDHRLNLEADCWVPQAEVSWNEQGTKYRQIITGPPDRFKVIDHAETYAFEMAMAWIDCQLMEDLTP